MTTDLLEERLQKLSIEGPDAGRVAARVLSRSSRRQARRLPLVAAAGVVTIALLVLIAYLVPAADTALASVPIAGDMLRDAGLVGAAGRITSVGSESSSSGYRLKLVGAYADSARTVLLLQADPPIVFSSTPMVVTDQFGRSYQFQNGTANMQTGDSVLQFEALAWPDAITGARITLHLSSVQSADQSGPGPAVPGTWTLPATLGVDQATALPTPADANLGPAHFHFNSVSYTPATIAIEMDVTGVSSEWLGRIVPDGGKGAPALTINLFDPNGEIINGSGGSGGNDLSGAVHMQFLGFRLGASGKYFLRVSYAGEGQFERVLTIP